ncbi:MAG: PRC-barrel domain-containing protein [Candidatus Eisenbacteria bacterium]|uniref:PRC-barrel domain-containing protein n=1 Tax=Eiseniibacteriota bacterium TaxID=2212470 RepID=A0A7Y2H1A9_UNCEI|nr:PRC-barrel domain-containing protein [Candidatus Eisenbacteria bacterium]
MLKEKTHKLLSADSLKGTKVINKDGEDLGKIEEIMLECSSGSIAYAVLSFGGVLGMGAKLFAVPWRRLEIDTDEEVLRLDVSKELLEKAPGFDKDDWPDFRDHRWHMNVHSYYGVQPGIWMPGPSATAGRKAS